jgi:hypothetical protein
MDRIRIVALTVCLLTLASAASAQNASPPQPDHPWRTSIYPLLVWVPIDVDTSVNVPPISGSGGGTSGDILDSRFDGAYFGGITVTNGVWRVDGDGMWLAFGGDRPERPFLKVDYTIIYGSAKVGRRVAGDFFVSGAVRRIALDYDVVLADLPQLSRKPGLWDPLVGIGWHRVGPKVEWHASFDGGGFGAGSDVDLSAGVRVDWKPVKHFGFTGGYNLLYLKISDDVLSRTVKISATLHGPSVGIGLYF